MDPTALAQHIRLWSADLGFQQCGIAGVDLGADEARLLSWLDEGLPVLHPPRHEALGFSACTVDPDGHQVRVFVPA